MHGAPLRCQAGAWNGQYDVRVPAESVLTPASRDMANTCPSAQIALTAAAATAIGLLDAALVVFGIAGAAALAVMFIGIRLRTHPALLFVALAAFLALLAIVGRWIRRWMAQPRRSTATSVFGTLGACAIIAAAQPLTKV